MSSTGPAKFDFQIKKVVQTSFTVNEQLYVPDPQKEIKIELQQTIGTNSELKLINFTLSASYHYDDMVEKLVTTKIDNVFYLPSLLEYQKGSGSLQIPYDLLISIVSVSIGHTRALLSKSLAGTVFQDTIIPLFDTNDMTNFFFPKNEDDKKIEFQQVNHI